MRAEVIQLEDDMSPEFPLNFLLKTPKTRTFVYDRRIREIFGKDHVLIPLHDISEKQAESIEKNILSYVEQKGLEPDEFSFIRVVQGKKQGIAILNARNKNEKSTTPSNN